MDKRYAWSVVRGGNTLSYHTSERTAQTAARRRAKANKGCQIDVMHKNRQHTAYLIIPAAVRADHPDGEPAPGAILRRRRKAR
jgi:hypothetical protein